MRNGGTQLFLTRTCAAGSEQAARAGTASHRGTPSPSDTTAVAAQTAANSIGTAADAAAQGSTAQPPTTDAPADSSARLSQEVILEHLGSLGFTEETFADLQPRWRWRLINLAVSAGSGAGHCMTLSQLHFLRAELDFRMLHGRHAAMTHHLARLIWLQLSAAELEDAADAVGGAAGAGARQDGVGGAVKIVDDGVKGMDVDTVAGVLLTVQQHSTVLLSCMLVNWATLSAGRPLACLRHLQPDLPLICCAAKRALECTQTVNV